MLEGIRSLIGDGLYEQARREALMLAESQEPDGLRAEAFLLAAECAAKQGDADEAEQFLRRAMGMVPADSESMDRAALNLGKVYLRRNEISLAEQVFLEALARHPGTGMMPSRARYGLGQVYEAQRRWDVAATMYQQAADGFMHEGAWERFVGAQQNRLWTLLMDSKMDEAGAALTICESSLARANDRQRHNHRALQAYYLCHTGATAEAADLTADLVSSGGPSAWAGCLAAITAGWLAHRSNMMAEAKKALKLAESMMLQASHETGSTDIINLVNELRSRAA